MFCICSFQNEHCLFTFTMLFLQHHEVGKLLFCAVFLLVYFRTSYFHDILKRSLLKQSMLYFFLDCNDKSGGFACYMLYADSRGLGQKLKKNINTLNTLSWWSNSLIISWYFFLFMERQRH